MMRGLGLLMLIVGAVFLVAVPYYQQHFTNFIITEQTAYAAGEGYQAFDVELAPNDAPLEILVTAQFTYQGDARDGRLTVPLLAEGPNGFLITDVFEINDGFVAPDTLETDVSNVQGWTHEHAFQDIEIDQAGIYTLSLGPLIEEGYSAKLIELTVIGRATPPWPDLSPLAWVLIGVGGFTVMFGGRRKPKQMPRSKTSRIGRRAPSKPADAEKPKQKWGRDA